MEQVINQNEINEKEASFIEKDEDNKKLNTDKYTKKKRLDERLPSRGLGDLITTANHIAITVSDVGKSLWFYTDIIGFQQIRRPNLDRHGAWLTMGSIELHLILGKPIVHSGDDLIVSHISLETSNIQEVLRRLIQMKVPFETNVRIPNDDIVTMFFVRDPDGYYIELCNCQIRNDFSRINEKVQSEGDIDLIGNTISLFVLSKLIEKVKQAKKRVAERDSKMILDNFDQSDFTEVEVDKTKLSNLVKRIEVYGDCVQGETKESLTHILRKLHNNVPKTIAYIKAKHGNKQQYQPPILYRNNEVKYTPPKFTI